MKSVLRVSVSDSGVAAYLVACAQRDVLGASVWLRASVRTHRKPVDGFLETSERPYLPPAQFGDEGKQRSTAVRIALVQQCQPLVPREPHLRQVPHQRGYLIGRQLRLEAAAVQQRAVKASFAAHLRQLR